MLHHTAINVSDLNASKNFYDELLSVINYKIIAEEDGWLGYGYNRACFWIGLQNQIVTPNYIAFEDKKKNTISAFYEKAIELGGESDGAPKYRHKFYQNHFYAFIKEMPISFFSNFRNNR